jgi:hypothetical protein
VEDREIASGIGIVAFEFENNGKVIKWKDVGRVKKRASFLKT